MKTKDKDLNDGAQSSDYSMIASQSDSVNLLVSIWRGDAPLVISYWVFGVLFTLVFAIVLCIFLLPIRRRVRLHGISISDD